MSAATHTHKILREDAAVAAIVGNRLFYSQALEGTASPFVVIDPGTETDGRTHEGQMGFREGRLNVICRAESFAGAHDLGEAVIDALGGFSADGITIFRNSVDGSDYVPADRSHRRIVGFVVRYHR